MKTRLGTVLRGCAFPWPRSCRSRSGSGRRPRLRVTPIAARRAGPRIVRVERRTDAGPARRDSKRPPYDVFVRDRMRQDAVLFDRTIASVTVAASVRFDNLTRRYQMSRAVDGRVGGARPTEDQDAVRQWMTRFDQIPVSTTAALEANGEVLRPRPGARASRKRVVLLALGSRRRAGQRQVHVHPVRRPRLGTRESRMPATVTSIAQRSSGPRPAPPPARAPSVPRQPTRFSRASPCCSRCSSRFSSSPTGRRASRRTSSPSSCSTRSRRPTRRCSAALVSSWRATSSSWSWNGAAALPFARFRVKLVALLLVMTLVPAMLVLIVGSELIRTNIDRWFNAPMDEILVVGEPDRRRLLPRAAGQVSDHGVRIARALAPVDLAQNRLRAIRDLALARGDAAARADGRGVSRRAPAGQSPSSRPWSTSRRRAPAGIQPRRGGSTRGAGARRRPPTRVRSRARRRPAICCTPPPSSRQRAAGHRRRRRDRLSDG